MPIPRGGYFVIEAEPGDSLVQSVDLRNESREGLRLRLAAVDALTGPLGGASYGLPDEQPNRTGAWISLRKRSVKLAPGAAMTVSFRIDVPTGAPSGEHLAGLTVWNPNESEEGSGTADPGEAGASVVVQTRRVVAVQVNLPGESSPELVISGITPEARPDGLYLGLQIANEGFGLTQGEGAVELPDEDFEADFALDTFVPGTEIAYPVKWRKTADDGEYRGRVEISYEGRTATWDGTFLVGEDVLQDLEDRGGASRRSLVPWIIAAVVALLVLIIAAVVVAKRRAARKTDEALTYP